MLCRAQNSNKQRCGEGQEKIGGRGVLVHDTAILKCRSVGVRNGFRQQARGAGEKYTLARQSESLAATGGLLGAAATEESIWHTKHLQCGAKIKVNGTTTKGREKN
jgi:hypothetical protein